MLLPQFITDNKDFQLMQSKWSSILNPIVTNPVTNPTSLMHITLINGVNVINHTLGQMQQGWIISDISAAATIYRSKPFNNLTLTLTSNAACTVTLLVY